MQGVVGDEERVVAVRMVGVIHGFTKSRVFVPAVFPGSVIPVSLWHESLLLLYVPLYAILIDPVSMFTGLPDAGPPCPAGGKGHEKEKTRPLVVTTQTVLAGVTVTFGRKIVVGTQKRTM